MNQNQNLCVIASRWILCHCSHRLETLLRIAAIPHRSFLTAIGVAPRTIVGMPLIPSFRTTSTLTQEQEQQQNEINPKSDPYASTVSQILNTKLVVERIHILEHFIRELAGKSAAAIASRTSITKKNHTVAALARNNQFQKSATSSQHRTILLSAHFLNAHIMRKWKQQQFANTQNDNPETLINPPDLLKKLREWNMLYPNFQYDIITIGIILDVLIHQQKQSSSRSSQPSPNRQRTSTPTNVPILAQQMLEFVRNEHFRTQSPYLQPNAYLYTQIIQAWAISGHPDAEQSIQSLYRTMTTTTITTSTHTQSIQPTLVTYNILLRFYAQQKNIAEMERFFNVLLSSTSISPDLNSWAAILHGYTQVGNIPKATSVYKNMMQLSTSSLQYKNKKQQKIWYNAVLDMLHMYRIRIHEDQQSIAPLHLESAEKLVHNINSSKILNSRQIFQIYVTLMDLYARTGNVSKVNAILQQLELQQPNHHPNQQSSRFNTVTANVLIKAYGKAQQGHTAVQLVKEMLQSQSPEARPTITTFNALLNALAESETSPTLALETFRFLDQDPQCKQGLGLEPNLFTFAALLKCVSRSIDPNAGNQAEQILHNMLSRWKQTRDESIKPNEVCYNLAIQACLCCGDHERAEAILQLLERRKSQHLGPRTYATLLKYYSSSTAPDAPRKAEQILDRTRRMFKAYPKVYPTVYCYNLVLAAWSRHKDVELAADSMWKLFLEMQEEKEYSSAPDLVTSTTLVKFYVRSGSDNRNFQWIQKADTLLHFMETSNDPSFQPSVEHYQMVMDGWLVLEDVSRATGVLLRRTKAGVQRKKLAPTPAAIQKVLQGWIHTYHPKNGIHLVRATVLLEELEEWKEKAIYVKEDDDNSNQEDFWTGPDRRNYETLLSAWRNSRHPKKNQYIERLEAKLTDMASQVPSRFLSFPTNTGNPDASPSGLKDSPDRRSNSHTSTTSILPG